MCPLRKGQATLTCKSFRPVRKRDLTMKKLLEINPNIDRKACARRFADRSRVQIRNVLTEETAREIQSILGRATKWGVAVQAGEKDGAKPASFSQAELAEQGGAAGVKRMLHDAHVASSKGEYAFRFAHYPIVKALNEKWDPGGVHEMLLEYLNTEDFLRLAREVTGYDNLVKADGQATLFAANHYLGRHIDSHVAEGWKVAYVLNLARDDWHPDWGGYLLFLDDEGDVVEGFRPRFNALNLFAVPQSHLVSYVAPFAPIGRVAITGWLRDR